jgi:hypothetical protein
VWSEEDWVSTTWPSKDPAEVLVGTFDFSAEIEAGETIVSAVVAAGILSGVDADPGALIYNGEPTEIVDGQVLIRMQGGVHQATYVLRCTATLSSGRVLVLAATLPVRSA